jgi:SAM-dependent methyltransferase
MLSVTRFWFSLPLLLGFLFHRPLLEQLTGFKMDISRGRSSLVSQLVSKMEAEKELESLSNGGAWYKVNLNKVKEREIVENFVQLGQDAETKSFIDHSVEQSDWLLTQIYYNVAKAFMSPFLCQTDINGWLGRGSMFVLSSQQFLALAKDSVVPDTPQSSMLDLGAGDGRSTVSLAKFYQNTYTTEVSRPMRKALSARGFTVLDIEAWAKDETYDLISGLNLFDRCDKPVSIIKDIHRSLKTGTGLFLVALVLPFKPYVESVASHKPSEKMNIVGETFEEQLASSVQQIQKLGFSLISWSRVPYLCEGDLSRPLYYLNNALILFRKD